MSYKMRIALNPMRIDITTVILNCLYFSMSIQHQVTSVGHVLWIERLKIATVFFSNLLHRKKKVFLEQNCLKHRQTDTTTSANNIGKLVYYQNVHNDTPVVFTGNLR